MVSPRSVLPSLFTSVTAADFTMVSPELWFTGVDVDEGPELIRGPARRGALGRRGVVDHTGVDVGLGDGVGRGRRAGLGGAGSQGGARARRRPAVGSVTPTLVRVTVPVLVTR